MRFANIITELYIRPWVIKSTMHNKMCEIVNKHIDGTAHTQDEIITIFEEEKKSDILQYYGDTAIIDINGVIGRKVSALEKSCGVVDVADISDVLDYAVNDDAVSGIVLRIDSPGGTVAGVPELAGEIRAASQTKPVVSFVDGMAASGAYWLASQTNAIIATQSSVVGSIGVYMALLDESKWFEQNGLKQEVIKAGKYKGMGIEGTSITEDQRKLLQSEVDEIHAMFKAAVQLGRGTIADEIMQGQDFFGVKGVDVGLVDGIGTMDQAIDLISIMEE